MAIGGKREGAGRKSQWRSPTKMMRLPAQYELAILDYAKRLDSEAESGASVSLLALRQEMDGVLLSLRPGDRRTARALFKRLLSRLV